MSKSKRQLGAVCWSSSLVFFISPSYFLFSTTSQIKVRISICNTNGEPLLINLVCDLYGTGRGNSYDNKESSKVFLMWFPVIASREYFVLTCTYHQHYFCTAGPHVILAEVNRYIDPRTVTVAWKTVAYVLDQLFSVLSQWIICLDEITADIYTIF